MARDDGAKIVLIPQLSKNSEIVIVLSGAFVDQILEKTLIRTLFKPKFNGKSSGKVKNTAVRNFYRIAFDLNVRITSIFTSTCFKCSTSGRGSRHAIDNLIVSISIKFPMADESIGATGHRR